ncbi:MULTISPECIES: fatty acid desaturase family protein [Oxalobacteraceae]|jgi:fatty acid desaturase|uniref:fatty acid desaturase family protein n=1 Tax=Oxalobacteraceae TaxID=75682 RepID=UPI0010A554ED|nr:MULTISPECIES: fatty acid desaturase family protein [Oxalobacteraceae]
MAKSFTAGQHAGACIRLDREFLKRMAAPAPYRLLLQTCIEWLWIVMLITAAAWLSNTAISIVCIMLIATRQHALLVLMHEYSHYQFSRKRPLLNDLVGDVFTAFPFLITIHGFRRNHMPHHRHASTDEDPDWIASMKKDRYRFPKTRKQVFLEIAKHCAGWYTITDLKGYTIDSGMAIDLPRSTRISRAVWVTGFVVATTWFGWWWNVFLYWIVPLATFLMAILYLRDMGEHFGMPSPGIAGSRTVLAGTIERLLICQNGVNFHTEHHLFPSVPFFRLNRLHRALMKDSQYRRHAVLTRGYLTGLVDEVAMVPSNAWRAGDAHIANGSLRS